MIVVHASVPIVPDCRERALDLAEDLVGRSRAEDGVLDYRAATDVTDPNAIQFFERYEDEAALETHSKTDHYREWLDALPDLLDGDFDDLDVTQFVVEEAFDPNADADRD